MIQPSPYAQMLALTGGMAACGDGLGVYVGTDVRATKPGWVFVEMPTTAECVQEALDVAKAGRNAWPEKES